GLLEEEVAPQNVIGVGWIGDPVVDLHASLEARKCLERFSSERSNPASVDERLRSTTGRKKGISTIEVDLVEESLLPTARVATLREADFSRVFAHVDDSHVTEGVDDGRERGAQSFAHPPVARAL